MPEYFTIDEIEQFLRDDVQKEGGAAKWCRKHKITHMKQSIHMIANGSAASLSGILPIIGVEKVTMYRSIDGSKS